MEGLLSFWECPGRTYSLPIVSNPSTSLGDGDIQERIRRSKYIIDQNRTDTDLNETYALESSKDSPM
jgi:hypothetical protein